MNINVTCRTCLKENIEMKPLFSDDNPLSKMITACTSTTVSKLDGLPQQICVQCSENVQASYIFKEQCESAFSRLKELFVLVDIDANNKADFVDACNTAFGVEKSIQTDEVCFHPCEMCNLKFLSEETLKEHRTTHTNYICRICTREFSRLASLRHHITITHETEIISKPLERIACSICDYVFARIDRLKRHMVNSHNIDLDQSSLVKGQTESKSFNCKKCGKDFTAEAMYKKHKAKCDLVKSSKKKRKKKKNHLDDDYFLDTDDGFTGSINNDSQSPQTVDIRSTRTSNNKTNKSLEFVQTEEIPKKDGNEKVPHNQVKETGLTSLFEKAPTDIFETVAVKSEYILDLDNEDSDLPMPLTIDINNIKKDDTNDNSDVGENNLLNKIDISKNKNDDKDKQCSSNYVDVSKKVEPTYKPKCSKDNRSKNAVPTKMAKEQGVNKSNHLCPDCNKNFKQAYLLKRHMVKHATVKPYSCPKCNKRFTQAGALKRHMYIHDEVKPYKCELCQKEFIRMDRFNIHRISHQEVKPFTCDACGKAFAQQELLAAHKECVHRCLTCDICLRKYKALNHLKSHMRTHKKLEPEYICDMCEKKFTNRQKIMYHLRYQHSSADKPFLCAECGMAYRHRDKLVVHMRLHNNEKPFKCKYCGRGFPRNGDLLVHERYHTGEKKHVCPTCGKAFQKRYSLSVHIRVHTGEKPYQCPHCDRSFVQSNDMKVHIRRHTGERFKCEVCSESFLQFYHLTKHKRNVHGIEIESRITRLEKFIPAGKD